MKSFLALNLQAAEASAATHQNPTMAAAKEMASRQVITSRRLRDSRQPGFETLQQQNPGGRDRLHIKAEFFPAFSPADLRMPHSPVVLSIEPGQKGGAANSYSVIQAWAPQSGAHRLLDQWREQATYPEFRSQVRLFIRKYRPSAVLIEDTGQGPSLRAEIRPQNGMEVVPIIPEGDKVVRLRRHRRTIRDGLVQLPQDAAWHAEFISEATQFPYGPFDDQVDALSQYLDWITEHPNLEERPSMAIAEGCDGHGRPVRPWWSGQVGSAGLSMRRSY
jgi:predicted phage terminase large subunit-like protein